VVSKEDTDNMKSWQHSSFKIFVGELMEHADKDRLLLATR
jgi:hypothetical protein